MRGLQPRRDGPLGRRGLARARLQPEPAWRAARGPSSCCPTRSTTSPGFHIHGRRPVARVGPAWRSPRNLQLGGRADTLPYMPLRLAAWRGQEAAAAELFDVMIRGAHARGEGCAITAAHYAMARPPQRPGPVRPGARRARRRPSTPTRSPPRPGRCTSWPRRRRAAATSISPATPPTVCGSARAPSGTAWAMGTGARTRALVEDGDAGESLHREALTWLGADAHGRAAWPALS